MYDIEDEIAAPPAEALGVSTTPVQPAHQDHITRGVIYGLISMALLAVMAAFAKQLAVTHNVIEIAFYRNSIAIVPLAGVILATGKTHLLKARKPLILFLRVTVGFVSLTILFEAYALLPLADATVIVMTAALFAPALSFLIGERVGEKRWTVIIIGLIGVAIMAHPTGHVAFLGAIAAFTTAFLQGFTHILLRGLKQENSFTVTFYFILGGALISGVLMPFFGHIPARADIPLIIGVGLSGGLAQFFLTSAFRSAPTAVIAPLNYTGLIWASALDIIFWKHIPDFTIYIGAAIIVISQAYILHSEKKERLAIEAARRL